MEPCVRFSLVDNNEYASQNLDPLVLVAAVLVVEASRTAGGAAGGAGVFLQHWWERYLGKDLALLYYWGFWIFLIRSFEDSGVTADDWVVFHVGKTALNPRKGLSNDPQRNKASLHFFDKEEALFKRLPRSTRTASKFIVRHEDWKIVLLYQPPR